MSSQPTLTRLLTMIIFACFAVYGATIYQLMQEGAQVRGTVNSVAALAAAFAGWRIAGPRIVNNLLSSVFGVLQGVIVAILLTLAAGATTETFRLGYKTRYDDLGEASQGFFGYISDGLMEIAVPELLVPLFGFCLVAGVVLSISFRMLEARRKIG